jgi:hypothetical protein
MMSNDTRQRRTGRSGQAIMLFALAFGIMAGVLGLVLDGGRIYYERNRVQMGADAGAIAGVQELRRGYNSGVSGFETRVIDDVELHGFNGDNATIDVHNPPISGPNTGDNLYVEVTVDYQVPTTFMRIFGQEYSTVSARSVAGLERAGDPCIIVLNETVPDAFKTNGTISLTSDCGIMVNSDAPSYAARNTGGGCIAVTWFGVTGNWDGSCITPTPKSGVTRVLDPLASMPQPSKPSTAGDQDAITLWNGEKFTIFSPGYYNNKLKVTNGFDNAYFQPGMYYLEQGMQITGGSVYGNEVFFYNNDDSGNKAIDISTQTTNTITLKAQTSGPYKGMLFWYNRNSAYTNNGSRVARGSASSVYSGAFYFPSTHLDWAGNPENSLHWTMVIANTLNISGDSQVSVYRVNKPTKDQAPPSFAAVMFE